MPRPSGVHRSSGARRRSPRVVGQRLAHAHEHDVRQPARRRPGPRRGRQRARCRARPARRSRPRDMLRVSPPGRSRRTGRPCRSRPATRRRASMRPGIAHQDRLDEGAVVQPPQRLAGGAAVGLEACAPASAAAAAAPSTSARAPSAGRSVISAGSCDEPGEVVRATLLGAEAGQPELRRPPPCARRA